ncbi:CBO0543 family protein [Cohnella lubricantis]|uniref:Uncharacterized protein n=1 Tax=Cohnella lubricantis TaxID=2163172 RepID=A0A841TGK2_9BACL|nr:CBO0543 family protein [Cohnella lubricantis]MBB6678077.1 hypothetical protein [Cohnella lubricantis]MBP2120055.1 hypothetical protein [Cohnella lubricantis]
MSGEYYLHHDLFSWQWWLLLILLFVSWIVWLRLADRSRMKDILLFGSMITLVIIVLDYTGSELQLWSYAYQLLPFTTHLSSVDFSVLPVCHMLVYQFCRSWKAFLAANTVMALLFAFVAEPLFVYWDIYLMDHWEFVYSFPIYIAKAAFLKWLLERISPRKQEFG